MKIKINGEKVEVGFWSFFKYVFLANLIMLGIYWIISSIVFIIISEAIA